MELPLTFHARVIHGRGRGTKLGTPTINLFLEDVPGDLEIGVYACDVSIGDECFAAAMHRGPRPTFNDKESCEIHLIDARVQEHHSALTIDVLQKLRDVQQFATGEDLSKQIAKDIQRTKEIFHKRHAAKG